MKNVIMATTSLLKTLVWIAMTILFGLLQLWLITFGSYITDGLTQAISMAEHIIVKDNILLFFSIAVISAMTVDFLMLMLQKPRRSINMVNTVTLIFAFIIVTFSIIIYLNVYKIPVEIVLSGDMFNRILNLNYTISASTILYVFGLKFYQFFHRL